MEGLVLGAAALSAALMTEAADWRPLNLVLLLFTLAVGSDMLTVEIRGLRASGSFLAIVLAMALLGPAPAAAIGAGSVAIDAVVSRRPWDKALGNIATYATFPILGALAIRWLMNGTVPVGGQDALGFAAVVFVVFMITNAINFSMV